MNAPLRDKFEEDEIKSSVNKFFDQDQLKKIGEVFAQAVPECK